MAEQPGLRDRPEPVEGRQSALHPLMRAGFIEYDRVVFFSDAVFAIAITLLAITLRVPKTPNAHGLHKALPSIAAFAISFLVIGFFWIAHHTLFRFITALDRRLIGLNLAFLGVIAFLPYPTNILSNSSPTQTAAVVLYAGCCALAGLLQAAVWTYATRPDAGLASPGAQPIRILYLVRILRVPVVFLLSMPLAIVSASNAPFVWLLIALSGSLMNRFWPLRETPEEEP